MELRLLRKTGTDASTVGELYVDGQFQCYTLEPVVRPLKIQGRTAIPAGRYQVIVNFSQRFQRDLPLLLDVPDFDGIRIHTGNTAKDTEGCILVGQSKAENYIGASRAAFAELFPKLQAALAAGQAVHIDIVAA
ncbi:DUF5675 family protein [Methylogaea oryzae]|uniref:DUF5675 domain-containing protein n=1 Tax=Methylogaea oryzae TaxID=1295382 RepID=A0A8D4VKY2_9GAMM|nr:DUF5675 family protein [Methylogaea oryzae]BBL69753.1 hypothetical protein MoryE10_03590 [Methylogaea oryzae]